MLFMRRYIHIITAATTANMSNIFAVSLIILTFVTTATHAVSAQCLLTCTAASGCYSKTQPALDCLYSIPFNKVTLI